MTRIFPTKGNPSGTAEAKGGSKSASSCLQIGPANDSFEEEASRVAEEVMGNTGVGLDWPFSKITNSASLRREPDYTGPGHGKKYPEQKASNSTSVGEAPPMVQNVLSAPGKVLDSVARGFFEPRFGRDFSQVRIHNDKMAAESAQAVNALAYTVGNHVVFDDGKYNLKSVSSRKLMAHELAHTVQQDQTDIGTVPLSPGEPTDRGEREASRASSTAVNRGGVSVQAHRRVGIQRQASPESPSPVMAPTAPHLDLAESASPFMAGAIGSVTLDGFETGKAVISSANQKKLAETTVTIQSLLKQYPGSTVKVTGHTDAVGKENDNLGLGQKRADAVQAVLLERGIPTNCIQAESEGEARLLIQTEKAEPRNRRVEIHFQPANQPPHILPQASPRPAPRQTPSPLPPIIPHLDTKLPQDSPRNPSLPDWFWKPLPPAPPSGRKSADDIINSAAKKITSFLPKSIQEKAQGLVKDAIEKGITSGLDAALQSAGVDATGREAIGKATEAAIKQKF
jgi:outer membrane protein OmpA-like peptidoglycan-associated protein